MGKGPMSDGQTELSGAASSYRWLLTCTMPLAYAYIGISSGISGPTLEDMTRLFNTDVESITVAMVMKAVGIALGAACGGIMIDHFPRKAYIFLCIVLLVSGGATCTMPQIPVLAVLGTLFLIQGCCQGVINAVCSSQMIVMWRESAPAPVHVLHTTLSAGLILSPVIAAPFLEPRNQQINTTQNSYTSHMMNQMKKEGAEASYENYNTFLEKEDVIYQGHVHYSYLIVASIAWFLSLVFFFIGCIPAPIELFEHLKKKSLKDMISPGTCADGRWGFGTYMAISLFLIYVSMNIAINSLLLFIFPIALQAPSLNFNIANAALLTTLFFTCNTMSRVLGGILSHFLSIKIYVFIVVSLAVASKGLLAFVGLNNNFNYWTWTLTSTFFMSPVYPAVMTWADRYIEVTGIVVGVIDIGIGVGNIICFWTSGVIYQRYGPKSLLIFTFGSVCFMFTLLVVAQVVGCFHGDRYKRQTKEGGYDWVLSDEHESILDENSQLSD